MFLVGPKQERKTCTYLKSLGKSILLEGRYYDCNIPMLAVSRPFSFIYSVESTYLVTR